MHSNGKLHRVEVVWLPGENNQPCIGHNVKQQWINSLYLHNYKQYSETLLRALLMRTHLHTKLGKLRTQERKHFHNCTHTTEIEHGI